MPPKHTPLTRREVTPNSKSSKSNKNSKNSHPNLKTTNDNTLASSTKVTATAATAAAARTTPNKNKHPEIISLIEMEENQFREAVKRSIRDAFSSPSTSSSLNKKPKAPEIIVLSDSSDDEKDNDDDGGGKMSRCSSNATIDLLNSAKVSENDDDGDDDDDDEIMIVDAEEAQAQLEASFQSTSSPSATAKSKSGDGEDDDEIEEIGIKGGMDLVHMRQHCTKNTFVQDAKKKSTMEQEEAIAKNKSACAKCYCYICDIPVKECKHWDMHCNASDKGIDAGLWKRMREKAKQGIVTSTYPSTSTSTSSARNFGMNDFAASMRRAILGYDDEDDYRGYDDDEDDYDGYYDDEDDFNGIYDNYFRNLMMRRNQDRNQVRNQDPSFKQFGNEFCRPGPFQPDKVQIDTPLANRLIQCQKCKWWNKPCRKHYVDVSDDWCQACGRVIFEQRRFNPKESSGSTELSEYKPVPGDVLLGEKSIPFRIKPRDPRKIQPYDEKWKEFEGQEGWVYDENEMRRDFYCHRIGFDHDCAMTSVSLTSLLKSMAVLEEDKIPDTATVRYSVGSSPVKGEEYNALETEALIINDQNHRLILQQLRYEIRVGNRVLDCNVKANWDEELQVGNIQLSVFIKSRAMQAYPTSQFSFAHFLGAWYNIFPLKLSELTNGHPCSHYPSVSPLEILSKPTGLRPMNLKDDEINDLRACFDDFQDTLDQYKSEADAISKKISFLASSGKKHSGGICTNDNSLNGTLTRFFREALVENLDNYLRGYSNSKTERFGATPAGLKLGIQSMHRDMCGPHEQSRNISISDTAAFGMNAILDTKDAYILNHYLATQLRQRLSENKTINGLMMQLENLHHNPVDHVEGLNVELFDFQREAVGWALEREKMVGGVQSALWTKLENTNAREFKTPTESKPVELYYSPVLDSFRKDKPREIRGGIIGEQMGLGKTVISLALILTNPAPMMPPSASLVKDDAHSMTSAAMNTSQWPERLPLQDFTPPKRAKYFCRGTLVVCNVSLVGQWIDEAKSKLKDPGLVYSYHGGGRKRCPLTLAKNAIVVTTYATLASDSNYWRDKSNDPNYCPPCEQIWWWRIICDESHALKDQNTHHFGSLNSIQAVNKWCVTGTPMNTSVKDLRGQLAFLGVENMSSYFSMFTEKMKSHFFKPSRRNSYSSSEDRTGHFLFMMRSLMMRHAIQMKSRVEQRSIMTLPPKEEKVLKVAFNKEEREEYLKLERNARLIYEGIKSCGTALISKNYLKISSALLPMRVACSGGVPEVDGSQKQSEGNPNDSKEEQVSKSDEPTKAKKIKIIDDLVFKSKFECLVKELKRIRDNEPNSKSLVFSQFFSTLQWMKQELPKHGFQFRTLSGDMPMVQRAKALRDFQQDPPTTIFLLSMRAGAVGINLTQANRVFLMEPAMNPALEAQAVGRVYRLGQRKSVQVIRMCIEDSIETRLIDLLAKKYGKASKPDAKKDKKKGVEEEKKVEDTDNNATSGGNLNNSNNSEADPSTSATPASVLAVGHMNQDKAALLANEFDILFNVA